MSASVVVLEVEDIVMDVEVWISSKLDAVADPLKNRAAWLRCMRRPCCRTGPASMRLEKTASSMNMLEYMTRFCQAEM